MSHVVPLLHRGSDQDMSCKSSTATKCLCNQEHGSSQEKMPAPGRKGGILHMTPTWGRPERILASTDHSKFKDPAQSNSLRACRQDPARGFQQTRVIDLRVKAMGIFDQPLVTCQRSSRKVRERARKCKDAKDRAFSFWTCQHSKTICLSFEPPIRKNYPLRLKLT